MLRFSFLLLLAAVIFQSCCFRRPTSAQSDRYETHHPRVPVIECIPCATMHQSPTTVFWSEAWGASGKWMVGVEPAYNFDHWRLFSDVGTHWWFNGDMTWAHREQIGVALFDPDNTLRPELGLGLHQRFYRSGYTIITPVGEQFIRKSPDYYWQGFAGIRMNVPYSNVEVAARVYRLQNRKNSASDWNFGIQIGFRL